MQISKISPRQPWQTWKKNARKLKYMKINILKINSPFFDMSSSINRIGHGGIGVTKKKERERDVSVHTIRTQKIAYRSHATKKQLHVRLYPQHYWLINKIPMTKKTTRETSWKKNQANKNKSRRTAYNKSQHASYPPPYGKILICS